MNELNPYQPPATDVSPSPNPQVPRRPLFPALIGGAISGGVLGSFVLAPFVRGIGDPTGRSIGAGLGGFAGLAICLLIRFRSSLVDRERHPSSSR